MNAIEITLRNPEILTIVFCETEEDKKPIINHLTNSIREYNNESGPNIVKSLPSEKVHSMISNNFQDEEENTSNESTPTSTIPEESKSEKTDNNESKPDEVFLF